MANRCATLWAVALRDIGRDQVLAAIAEYDRLGQDEFLAAYGFQHVLAFYAGAVLVPIIVAGALKLSQADLIRDIHERYVAAGARVIETNSFGANAALISWRPAWRARPRPWREPRREPG